ncbi:glucan 1,3-alpha-glucosidase ROT2 NDAI_0F01900 [Naumovozyma dairenensis CBS 421]|uniref:Glucosidase II subunit alpha n=1 Tax=Naumovozyma dairenensis (strain ATCC 10597 / BCRC 20456 / CBS 421 / NBRC 0211 / NRRL Y-12639) TaxID=1071378 RepID=G0WCJ7_NAUDC|nr:hypothetical protein NDAI_0F01900 [Naumovozyma dairenensis CBS 421]CCD25508.1 hypothetical protein NDAI_0F01900 [Naumovozyma dairenensis CBS 421]
MLQFRWVLALTSLLCQLQISFGFTDYLLKTCSQSGFCQRNRDYSKAIQYTRKSYYQIDENSIQFNETDYSLKATITKTIPRADIEDIVIELPFSLSFLNTSNSIRFTIDENRSNLKESNSLNAHRFNGTANWAFRPNVSLLNSEVYVSKEHEKNFGGWIFDFFSAGSKNGNDLLVLEDQDAARRVEISLGRFELRIYRKGKLTMTVNERSLLNIEHYRRIEDNFQNLLPEEPPYNMFKDDFEYSKDDTIPFGPESVALDFTFHNFQNVYGIPEHANSLRLKDTTESEPYRLFNVDVFEYNLNSTMPMYGAIPLMIAANPNKQSAGLFWLNSADTWIDIDYSNKKDTKSHWISESGIIDVVIFLGESPADIINNYTELTGRPDLPLLSSIGYHQCRWNYNDELDVLTVEAEMDKAGIPFDFLWLDLEYTDNKQYFTWKPDSFPNPKRLLNVLDKLGRQLAVLIDPHLKDNYFVSKIVAQENAAVKDCNGNIFKGQCWPGLSLWIETFSELGRKSWSRFFKNFVPEGVTNLHIWNDMNEPSIFSGPETTAPKDLIHDGFEERSVHNLYGLTVHETSYNAMKEVYSAEKKRPFILTRAFFSGSQRTAATWTGDNVANWDYLGVSIPMILTNNIMGMPFIGADVAGFAGNPEPELLVRWYQAGLWYPFFRAHAHIDSIRREPYLFEEPVRSIIRDAVKLRYILLPTFYTAFRESNLNGSPIMRPMFYEKPQYGELYSVDTQFFLGDSGILVKPIVHANEIETQVIFTPGVYYDLDSLSVLRINGNDVSSVTIPSPLEKIPSFIEGGHIITKKERYRRSSKLMRYDPYILVIAPDIQGNANGKLYLDDGETFHYQNGNFIETEFNFKNGNVLENNILGGTTDRLTENTRIEKIIIAIGELDSHSFNDKATIKIGSQEYSVPIDISEEKTQLYIKNPLVTIGENWDIHF